MTERNRSWLNHITGFISGWQVSFYTTESEGDELQFHCFPRTASNASIFKVLVDETKTNNITDEVIYSNGHTKNGCKISPPVKKKKNKKNLLLSPC